MPTAPSSSAPRVARGRRKAAPADRLFPSTPAAQLHLLRRATWGPRPQDLDAIAAVGTKAWLEAQLAPETVADRVCDEYVGRFQRYKRSTAEVHAAGYWSVEWDLMFEVGRVTLLRQVWSERQLLEVVVDVWNNLLHVTCPSSEVWDNRADYDRTIRRHALGSFADLLVESAKSPSMLLYLDNTSSSAAHPNENYARELLELHTVGVDAGYTEADVKAGARLLTGLAVGADGLFTFDAARHDSGGGTAFGFSWPAHAPHEGLGWAERYLRYLALHPATARRVSRRLAVRFVADEPPASLVERMAQTWTATGASIRAVLWTLFSAPEFWDSAGQKYKTPQEDFVSTLRALGVAPERSGTQGIERLYWMPSDAGHAPLAWGAPDGYPDTAAAWQSPNATLQRWNRHMDFAAAWYPPDLTWTPARQLLPQALPATWGALVDAMAERLVHSPITADERAGVLLYLERRADERLDPREPWLGWGFPYLAAFVLDTPTFSKR
ncbi:DUF1800 domain-containing protein [Kineococcus sp. G2]|uniref:DUF1800 domain-containing protein n=1 Tax=Kineococcus sp. G2 TaxID=3127484 RepID=UPI00301C0962